MPNKSMHKKQVQSKSNLTQLGKKNLRNKPSRRQFIKGSFAGWVFLNSSLGISNRALANNTTKQFEAPTKANHAKKKVVWIFLRGALDPLHTVLPISDPDFATYRRSLLEPIQHDLLALDGNFALHPNLPFMHQLYKTKQMTPVVAVASGYRQRSHFDAQDQMESGLNQTEHDSGWLARASTEVAKLIQRESAPANSVAIARSIPIALRGSSKQAETWYPSVFPEADEDLLQRLNVLYEDDVDFSQHLQALISQKQNPNMQMQEKRRPNFTFLAKRCGELLANNETQFAMLELGGWDTHNNQAGRLARLFTQLDNGIQAMRDSLGRSWDDTLVVVSTEFGRTVALNGTGGTDHGTGSNMLIVGGALQNVISKDITKHYLATPKLQGGKVFGKWPGLATEKLFAGRDLMPTTDIRDWFSAVLVHQWGLSRGQIKRIFPDI